jgi:cell division protein ZapD
VNREATGQFIQYEYPLNERIRTLLRLEDLFERLAFHRASDHYWQHHSALTTLFEIIDVGARADLKSDLLQELDRQKATLAGFRDQPGVSNEALNRVLTEIESAWQRLNATAGKIGQHLRDNEWLMSVRSRTIIPGGACEFDIPSYYAWQQQDPPARHADLETWAAPFQPLRDALAIVLRLLRESGQRNQITAPNGSYQQMLGGKLVQMLQIRMLRERAAIPEISANKYMLWIRFTSQAGDGKPKTVEEDIGFELSLCNL